MCKEDSDIEVKTYKVDGVPRLVIKVNTGEALHPLNSVIVEGEEWLKCIVSNINSVLIESPKWPEGPEIVLEGDVRKKGN